LHTQDPDRAKGFYKELFDWKFENVPDMNYTIINVREGARGRHNEEPSYLFDYPRLRLLQVG
jgi:predicted enzyme related to lactoylglutathione lyase